MARVAPPRSSASKTHQVPYRTTKPNEYLKNSVENWLAARNSRIFLACNWIWKHLFHSGERWKIRDTSKKERGIIFFILRNNLSKRCGAQLVQFCRDACWADMSWITEPKNLWKEGSLWHPRITCLNNGCKQCSGAFCFLTFQQNELCVSSCMPVSSGKAQQALKLIRWCFESLLDSTSRSYLEVLLSQQDCDWPESACRVCCSGSWNLWSKDVSLSTRCDASYTRPTQSDRREVESIDRLSTTFDFTREERVASTSRGNVHVDATRVWGL